MSFFSEAKILITGHTGFKGSWLSQMLAVAGASVSGFSLSVPTDSRHVYFSDKVQDSLTEKFQSKDIRVYEDLSQILKREKFDFIFHLAAQPLVSEAYSNPLLTFQTNTMGTVNLLEASRNFAQDSTLIIITSDKAYLNLDTQQVFIESDRLGGLEAYSGSKAAAEISVQAFASSYKDLYQGGVATARAGNVFGGGDWSSNRLIPDVLRGIFDAGSISIRKPDAVRPWTSVWDVLLGYLYLAKELRLGKVHSGEAWNFASGETLSVLQIAEVLRDSLNRDIKIELAENDEISEPNFLQIDSQKARATLQWQTKASLNDRLIQTAQWHKIQSTGTETRRYSKEIIESLELP